MTDWIDTALADAPVWQKNRSRRPPWVRLKEPGDLIAGTVTATDVQTWANTDKVRPILSVRLERAFGEHEAGAEVRLVLDLSGLVQWFETEQPDVGDSVVVLFEDWSGNRKIIRAKAVDR